MVCPNLDGCSFINSSNKDIKREVDYCKKVYCEGDYEKCARYILSITTGDVPEDLWPNGKK